MLQRCVPRSLIYDAENDDRDGATALAIDSMRASFFLQYDIEDLI